MFHTKIRFYLILLFLFLGIILHFEQGWSSAWYLYVAALILWITHFLFGNVWAAFGKLKKGKLDDAERLIEQIKRPQYLAKGHRAYYHLVKGMIALQRKAFEEAEAQLTDALAIGLRSGNDNALTALNLAHICFVEKRYADAQAYLQQARSYQSNDLLIKENLEKMEQALQGRV